MNTITLICMFLAACSHAMFSLIAHEKIRLGQHDDFIGSAQWVRKYKRPLTDAPNNWYYKIFGIRYVEKFPLSATALVFVTDAFHFFQWLTTKLVFLSITRDPLTYVIIWLVWSIGFNVIYSILPKIIKR